MADSGFIAQAPPEHCSSAEQEHYGFGAATLGEGQERSFVILSASCISAGQDSCDGARSEACKEVPSIVTFSTSHCSFFLLGFCFFCLVNPSVASSNATQSVQVANNGDRTDISDSVVNSVRREGVDSSLRKYAFLAVSQVDAGTVFDVTLTPFLSGIKAQAIRLESDTLKEQGLTFNEFSIPQGANVDSDSFLLLIYRKIFNFTVYSLPLQYEFGGPVVGIISYSPPNFTTDDPNLPQVPITFPNSSISVHVPLYPSDTNTVPLCAFFSADGSVTFGNVTSLPNVCMSATLGDVALVFPSEDLPSKQSSTPALPALQSPLRGRKVARHWKLAVGGVCLAFAGVALCVVISGVAVRLVEQLKVAIMAHFADNEEALQTSLIGISRPPTAAVVRTKPTLEMDMARFRD